MPTSSTIVQPKDPALRSALKLAAVFALLRLLFQFALTIYTTHIGYGYFRDEFYYIACGRHLAWGYVDHGPVVAVQARLGELLFGDSIFGIRVLSAVAQAVMVFLTGLLAWSLGGRKPSQALAMLCVLLAPGYLAMGGFLSMNSCEPMFWMTATLALILLTRRCSPQLWWTVFALAAGVGLLNKPSMTFFLATIGIGLLCTPQRRILFTRHAVFGIGVMAVIALPNLVWQMQHHWATLEFLRNETLRHKNVILGPVAFFVAQLMQLHPINAVFWMTGLVALLRAKSIPGARWIAIAYLVFLPLMWTLHAKDYYLEPFYPVLFAAGGVAFEHRFRNVSRVAAGRTFAFPVMEAVLALLLLGVLPLASPVLRPLASAHFATALRVQAQPNERNHGTILPQFYADRFGWDEIVTKMDAAYRSLSPADRAQACITGDNYGEAGALNFLGPRVDPALPTAISSQNNYWLWGPQGCTFKVVVAISGGSPEDYKERYESVQVVGHIDDPFAMTAEHRNIYILRDRKASNPAIWDDWKNYI